MIITENCMSCGMCSEVCPNGAIKVRNNIQDKGYRGYYIDDSLCMNCGLCLDIADCPANAIKEK
jgi:formate hydrogenlyase subunit 6/NADH:ubiquinone oxidoreductase subunit I